MGSKKVNIDDLRVGMYVSQLDRDWLGTPFLIQGFHIEKRRDIDMLSQYCEHVWVDADLGAKKDVKEIGLGDAASTRLVELKDEHQKVETAFKQARDITKEMLEDIRLGGAVNSDQAKENVNSCVESVLRHPDALMWMAKIREDREYTAEHCLNVCILSIAFGRHLGLSEPDLMDLGLCGFLHDVGKVRIPLDVLDKPGALTPKELKIMRSHTIHGRNLLLEAKNVYQGSAEVAMSHHERIDGGGYPCKLGAGKISKFSRIISLVDAYDAMTATRCYSPAKTSTEALKIIYEERGKQFDEILALEFIKTIGLYPPGSIVELYSNEVGIVIETNEKLRHLPKIALLVDQNKKPRETMALLDLSLIANGKLSNKYLIKQVWCDGSFDITIRDCQQQGIITSLL